MNNLKQCPFCGGKAVLGAPGYERYSPYWCKCVQCGAEGPVKASESEAIEEWNRRSQNEYDFELEGKEIIAKNKELITAIENALNAWSSRRR